MWYLESLFTDKKVFEYDIFIENNIKKNIFHYFSLPKNKEDELWLYKKSSDTETVGDDFISVFLFVNGVVVKEVYRGNKTFFKELRKPI